MVNRKNYLCGETADALSPCRNHYKWHIYWRTEPCPKSGKPLPDWERPPQPPPSVCGGEETATRPTDGHYRRHLRRGQTPCPAAVMERRWLAAETRLGRSLNKEEAAAAIRPRRYTCGGEEDYREPSWGHYAYHRRRGEEPCPKSRREIREAERANNAAKRKKERQ